MHVYTSVYSRISGLGGLGVKPGGELETKKTRNCFTQKLYRTYLPQHFTVEFKAINFSTA